MLPFAVSARGSHLLLPLDQPLIVLAGASGGGKSTIMRLWADVMVAADIVPTVIDPSGSFPVAGLPVTRLESLEQIEKHVTWLESEFDRRRNVLAQVGALSFLEVPDMPTVVTILDESQDLFDAESVAEKSDEGHRLRTLAARLNKLHRRQRKCGFCTIMSFTTGAKSTLAIKWTNATVKVATYLEESESRAFIGDERAHDQTLRSGRFLMLSPATLGWVYGRTLRVKPKRQRAAPRSGCGRSRRRRPQDRAPEESGPAP